MDKDTKNFFEKLAGITSNNKEVKLEPKTILEQEPDELPEEVSEIPFKKAFDELDEIEGELAIDLYSTPSSFIVESTIAGVNPEDIDISITPESITIKGSRVKEEKIKTENYIHQECYWGRFSRSIVLPQEIDPDKVQANIKNGILKITLSKINKNKTKKIKVKSE